MSKASLEMFKVIFGLKNLRRAEGQAGKQESFVVDLHGTDATMYIDEVGKVSPLPSSLVVLVRILCMLVYVEN